MKNNFIENTKKAKSVIEHCEEDIKLNEGCRKSIGIINHAISNGKKVLISGNGGSAAQAQHMAAELVCRFRKERKAIAALSLCTDSSVITSISNDYDYEKIFCRQIEALGQEDDVYITFTTSGKSKNVLLSIEQANIQKLRIILVTGRVSKQEYNVDVHMEVPSKDTPTIQIIHQLLLHSICEGVEECAR